MTEIHSLCVETIDRYELFDLVSVVQRSAHHLHKIPDFTTYALVDGRFDDFPREPLRAIRSNRPTVGQSLEGLPTRPAPAATRTPPSRPQPDFRRRE